MIRTTKAEIRRLTNEARNNGLAFPKPTTPPKDWKKLNTKRIKRTKGIRRVSPMKAEAIVEFKRLKPLAFARDGGKCVLCGMALKKWTAHHILPTANGGENVLWNLACLCCNHGGYGACHETAHTMGADAKLELYRRNADRYAVRALESGCEWFWVLYHSEVVMPDRGRYPREIDALRAGLAARVAATGDPFDPEER